MKVLKTFLFFMICAIVLYFGLTPGQQEPAPAFLGSPNPMKVNQQQYDRIQPGSYVMQR